MGFLPTATRNSPRIVGHRAQMSHCETAPALLRLSQSDPVPAALNLPGLGICPFSSLSWCSLPFASRPSFPATSCWALYLSHHLPSCTGRVSGLAPCKLRREGKGKGTGRGWTVCLRSSAREQTCHSVESAVTPPPQDNPNSPNSRPRTFPLSRCWISSSSGKRRSSLHHSFKPTLGIPQHGPTDGGVLESSLSLEPHERLGTLPMDLLLRLSADPRSAAKESDRSKRSDGACLGLSSLNGTERSIVPEKPAGTDSGRRAEDDKRGDSRAGMEEGVGFIGSTDEPYEACKSDGSLLLTDVPSQQNRSSGPPEDGRSHSVAFLCASGPAISTCVLARQAKILVLEETGEPGRREDTEGKGVELRKELPERGDEARASVEEQSGTRRIRSRLLRRHRQPLETSEDLGRWPRDVSFLFGDPVTGLSSAGVQEPDKEEPSSASQSRLQGGSPGRSGLLVGSLVLRPSGFPSFSRNDEAPSSELLPVREQPTVPPSRSAWPSASLSSRFSASSFEPRDSSPVCANLARPDFVEDVYRPTAAAMTSAQAADEPSRGAAPQQDLTPLDKLRMHRSRREFEGADHVLKLQALATPRYGISVDRSSSQREGEPGISRARSSV